MMTKPCWFLIVQFKSNKNLLYDDTTTMRCERSPWPHLRNLPVPGIAFRSLYSSNGSLNCSQCSICSFTRAQKIHIFHVTLVWKIWKRGGVDCTMITVLRIMCLDEQWRGNLLIKSWQSSHSHSQWHIFSPCRFHAFSVTLVYRGGFSNRSSYSTFIQNKWIDDCQLQTLIQYQ